MSGLRRIAYWSLVAAFAALSACYQKSDAVFNDTEETNLPAKSELPLEVDPSLAFFDNYMLPPPISFNAAAPVVRGIYVTSNRAGGAGYLHKLIDICLNSDINAMVIDVRTEEGLVTFKGMEFADNLGVSVNTIPDIHETLALLKENGIYPIARVVAFKDSNTRTFRPDLYIHEKDGSVWLDPNKMTWLNPYNPEACDYVLEFAKGAAEAGFSEIQFDYIRFAASARLENADFGETEGLSRTQAIEAFADKAMKTLKPYGVNVSADVYGTIIDSDIDANIVGQDYVGLAKILDVICPMVYPSHYANGSMGLDIPDLVPYDTIYKAMELSGKRLEAIPEDERRAVIRPWLQDFTASWLQKYLKYTSVERGAQIQGAYDAGLSEWLLWDPGNNYDAEGTAGAPGMKLASGAEDE
ncbi:MAG: putative glycoside hydrolase [Clostridiales bacterium]|nr:putative glycoside hydrolase [Clostridiales bacterium]